MNYTLLTEEEAAKFLNIAKGTLGIWRCKGRYNLPFVKVGGSVRYKKEDLIAFIESRTFTPDNRAK